MPYNCFFLLPPFGGCFRRRRDRLEFTTSCIDRAINYSFNLVKLILYRLTHCQRHRKRADMSRISQAQTLIRSLNPTPLRTSNSQQLNAALENISNRAFPNPSNIAPGSREEQALDGMIKSLERLRAGRAMADVSRLHCRRQGDSIDRACRQSMRGPLIVLSTLCLIRRYGPDMIPIITRGSWMVFTTRQKGRAGVGGNRSSSSRGGSDRIIQAQMFQYVCIIIRE